MMVELISDDGVQQDGFEASWWIPGGEGGGGGDDSSGASVSCTGSCECPGAWAAYSGTITDGDGDYPESAACQWTIQASAGTEVSLQFTVFDTELDYDFVNVWECDSPACNIKAQLTRLDGEGDTTTTYTSTTGYMMVELTSDDDVQQDGFEASWWIPGRRRWSSRISSASVSTLKKAEAARADREKQRAMDAFTKLMNRKESPEKRTPRRKLLSADEEAAHLVPHGTLARAHNQGSVWHALPHACKN